jgi:hypothetical protein
VLIVLKLTPGAAGHAVSRLFGASPLFRIELVNIELA